jgi:hypothetical protein
LAKAPVCGAWEPNLMTGAAQPVPNQNPMTKPTHQTLLIILRFISFLLSEWLILPPKGRDKRA